MIKCNIFGETTGFIKDLYKGRHPVPLHEPVFFGNEMEYIKECIDSTFVSSVGKFVDNVEKKICEVTGAKFATAVVNGTSALHAALKLAGVENNTEVITQPLTFVATCNAISYCGAKPVFVDVDKDTAGMSPGSLEKFFEEFTEKRNEKIYNKISGKELKAIVPVHTFGHPCKIDSIVEIAQRYNIPVIEDAAESLGSSYKNGYTGTFGLMGVLSFNGNKIATAGGGGAIVTDDESLAKKAKHITITAKAPNKWEYFHDEVGYNYRMPNINAALLLGQLENLDKFIKNKRELASAYAGFFKNTGIEFFREPNNARSNYWLNTLLLKDRKERDEFLEYTNNNGVMTRPCWVLMNNLPMYRDCFAFEIKNAYNLENRMVNIPSGVRM